MADDLAPAARPMARPMARHRAFGCFFALQSVALLPLVQFVVQCRAEKPPLAPDVEKQHKNLEKASLRMQLLFIRDHWATHFSEGVAGTLRSDVQTVLKTQEAAFYSGSPASASIWKAIHAIERLLEAVGASDDVKAQARPLPSTFVDSDFLDVKILHTPKKNKRDASTGRLWAGTSSPELRQKLELRIQTE